MIIRNFPIPKAVIFDWDNTIIEYRKIWHEVLYAVTDNMGVKREIMEKSRLFDPDYSSPAIQAFPDVFGDSWKVAWKLYIDFYQKEHLEGLVLKIGVLEFLNLLYDHQMTMVIVSNKEQVFLENELSKLHLNHFFYKTIGTQDHKPYKPDPSQVYTALDYLKHEEFNHNVWFIGDSAIDIACANAAGCLPILLSDSQLHLVQKQGDPFNLVDSYNTLQSIYKYSLQEKG